MLMIDINKLDLQIIGGDTTIAARVRRAGICARILLCADLFTKGICVECGEDQNRRNGEGRDQDLKLNGAGIRYKVIFGVYAAALYLVDKNTVPDVLAAPSVRRIELVMLRDVSSRDFSRTFMAGVQNNVDRMEK